MLKGRGQFYIRVGSTNQPASRETVLNLFKLTVDRIASIEALQLMASLLKNDLEQVKQQLMRHANGYIPIVSLDSFRNAAANCTWFMMENDLVQDYMGPGPDHREGFYSTVHHLEALNSGIKEFNSQRDVEDIVGYFSYWDGAYGVFILKYIDKVIDATKEFLGK